jgi:large subunit ribosomal protein L6
MSRIGRKPVPVPNGVTVTVNGPAITVKGPKGELSRKLHPDMQVKVENGTVTVDRPSDADRHRALHGLTRSLIANMVEGVTQGYKKQLEITGVGYKAEVQPFGLQLALGYSRWSTDSATTAPQPIVGDRGSGQREGRSVAAEIRRCGSRSHTRGRA